MATGRSITIWLGTTRDLCVCVFSLKKNTCPSPMILLLSQKCSYFPGSTGTLFLSWLKSNSLNTFWLHSTFHPRIYCFWFGFVGMCVSVSFQNCLASPTKQDRQAFWKLTTPASVKARVLPLVPNIDNQIKHPEKFIISRESNRVCFKELCPSLPFYI